MRSRRNRTERRDPLLKAVRRRNLRNLTAGRTLTHCANAMASIALAFAVLDLTGSAVHVGLVVAARSLANVALVLLGGMLADRLPKSVILQGSSLAAAAAQAAVATLLLTGSGGLPALVALSTVNGAVAALSLPAAVALTPYTVPAGELRAANAVARMGVQGGMIAGASLGGAVTAALSPAWGFVVNATLFAGAAVAYHAVRIPQPPRQGSRPLHELREGWREFTARRWVWLVVLQFFVVNAVTAGGVQVLGPTIADDTFGRTLWGLVLAVQMAGALVGGVFAARSRVRHALRLGVAVVAFDALPLLALAETAPLALLVAAMFVNGVAMEQFGVAWEVSLQENIPADRLARVYSYDVLGSLLALPLGEVAAGWLAERYGTRLTLLGGTALLVATTGLVLRSRQVRGLTVRARAGGVGDTTAEKEPDAAT